MAELPTGTVTFLFTDIEGSSRLWELHPETMPAALARHDALLTECIQQHGGVVIKSRGEGDSLFAVFSRATDAVAAAVALQQALCAEPWPAETETRVRVALHTGDAALRDGDYFGAAVNRCARLRAVAHGGQVLLSLATQELVRDSLPAGVRVRDLGEHRLRDLARPERVFQLLHPELPADFPPLASLSTLPNNLPQQVTSFIGREKEMAEVRRLLTTTRLLTLTGAGGTGKTRLSLQVAADLLEDQEDGVWLVELAVLADPSFVLQAVAEALGVREAPGKLLTLTLVDWLKPKRLLLILDNCEHLLSACASLAEAILRGCPRVRILATSREGLNIAGETTYRLPSLASLDPRHLPPTLVGADLVSALTQYEAVRLFIDRALAALPSFTVSNQNAPAVAQVCSRLDGIPLAIELAAARVRALPVEKLNERLDDRFHLLTGGARTALPRQQTLRALIDWSYELLRERERVLLRCLSVFAGGWTLEAAEAVGAGEDLEAWEVLDRLTSLVEKSLVIYEEPSSTAASGPPAGRGGETRYRLLESVRQYARDRLLEEGEAAPVRDRHLAFFLQLAQQAEAHSEGPEHSQWLARLETEHDNLRAVLEWSLASNAVETGLRLAAALRGIWATRGHHMEAQEWLTRLLAQVGEARTVARGRALVHAGDVAWRRGDLGAARGLIEEGLAIGRELDDRQGVADALHGLGAVVEHEGDLQTARSFFQECLAIRREASKPSELNLTLFGLGWVALKLGEYTVAREHFEEGLAIARSTGNTHMIAWGLRNQGEVAQRQGDRAAARAFYAKSLAIMHDKFGRAGLLGSMGALAMDEGDWGAASSFYRESLALIHEQGLRSQYILLINALAEASAYAGNHARAARLLGAGTNLPAAVGSSLPLSIRPDPARAAAAVRAALGEEASAAAWAEGQAMAVEQVIADALQSGEAVPAAP